PFDRLDSLRRVDRGCRQITVEYCTTMHVQDSKPTTCTPRQEPTERILAGDLLHLHGNLSEFVPIPRIVSRRNLNTDLVENIDVEIGGPACRMQRNAKNTVVHIDPGPVPLDEIAAVVIGDVLAQIDDALAG